MILGGEELNLFQNCELLCDYIVVLTTVKYLYLPCMLVVDALA
jgi:hypothetical protein